MRVSYPLAAHGETIWDKLPGAGMGFVADFNRRFRVLGVHLARNSAASSLISTLAAELALR
jgi:hypothetical protein